MMRASILLTALILILQSCATLTDSPKYQLADSYYEFRQSGSSYKKVFIATDQDSIKIYSLNGEPLDVVIPSADEYFRKRSFDVDVMTILMKYRPSQPSLPQQLSTNFNGNVYLGYRTDRFQLDFEKTPAGTRKTLRHTAITYGIFGGLGSTAVNPWTTNNNITDEYDGVVLSYGFAFMAGINALTVGVGLGWDNLAGRDKDVWIYQNKPWLGLTLGLNLN